MKKRVILFVIFLFIINFSLLVNATILKGNISGDIQTSYAPSENLKGWINISVINEFYDILVKGNIGEGNIKLIDLLNLNNADYYCSPEDCLPYYNAVSGETSKTFSLKNGEEKVLAFKLDGIIKTVSSLSFDLNINNELSCENPVEIDILNDNNIEWKSTKISSQICNIQEKYGCYDKSASSTEIPLGSNTPYCEKIKLKPSKSYNLGAYIKNNSEYKNNIKMTLYNLEANEIASCIINFSNVYPEKEYYCKVNLSKIDYDSEEYYVCIKKTNDLGDYLIKRETTGEKCGFYDYPENAPETFSYDYYIFAEFYKFDNIGKINFNQSEYNNQGNSGSLSEYLTNYLEEKYSLNCTDGCTIPIRFKTNTNSNITISNISLNYDEEGGLSSTNNIYETEITKPKISFNYTELNLDESNITVPSNYGNYTFNLFVKDTKIINKTINILKVPEIKSLYPIIIPASYPTTFVLKVETQDNKTIVNYTWNFGDGTITETETNSVKHVYSNISTYNLKVKVTDSEGLSSEKTFIVSSVSPKETINNTLIEYSKRIQNLTLQIATFPSYSQTLIKKVINIDNLTSQLQELQRQYNSAGGDNNKYISIMNELSNMNLPYKINITSKGDFPYYINYEKINLDSLKEAGAGDYEEENSDNYKKAIGAWQQENINMFLHYEYVSGYYDNEVNPLITIFKLKITPNEKTDLENYVIFSDAIKGENFDFSDSSYNSKQVNNDIAVIFDSLDDKEILFYYLGEKQFNNLNVYISPKFSSLDILTTIEPCDYNGICEKGETWKNCRADCKPWKIAWVLWVFLIFIAFIVYLMISQWYRVHYESKLFKNRQDITNLLNFINIAIHQGLTYSTIRKKLKEMSWNDEQISYVINKYQGKSIIPLDISRIFRKKTSPSQQIQQAV